jgi:hypothetical protein
MTPRSACLALLGGAVGLVFLERLTKHKDPGKATPIFVPDIPDLSSPPSLKPPPVLVQGDPIPIVPGQAYHVSLVTHRVATSLATEDRVRTEAEKRGFIGVSVSKGKPPGWPGTASGDYYVSATYAGAPKSQPRTEGNFLGSVDVVEVWQG